MDSVTPSDKKKKKKTEGTPEKCIRAIRVELAKPLNESWDEAGKQLRLLSSATPKLLNAAYDALAAIQLVGTAPVKAVVAPDAKAASPEGIAYQACKRALENLRAWRPEKSTKGPYEDLEVPASMLAAIARVATQAFGQRNKKGRPSFQSKRIVLRASETKLRRDGKGHTLEVVLRTSGRVVFAIAGSSGRHLGLLRDIVSGKIKHGDCKIRFDEDRRKWYALIAYEAPRQEIPNLDPACALIVHRGLRNALTFLSTDGQYGSISGKKYMSQRLQLKARMQDARRMSPIEKGSGNKGHGKARYFKSVGDLEGKVARVTMTFVQQLAARVKQVAIAWGCGQVIIEDYGGLPPDESRDLRRVLERGPLHQMKLSIVSCLEPTNIELKETPSAFISTTCPRCNVADPKNHVIRTGMFRCISCGFERPADWVATFWMGTHSGVNMSCIRKRLEEELRLSQSLKEKKNG